MMSERVTRSTPQSNMDSQSLPIPITQPQSMELPNNNVGESFFYLFNITRRWYTPQNCSFFTFRLFFYLLNITRWWHNPLELLFFHISSFILLVEYNEVVALSLKIAIFLLSYFYLLNMTRWWHNPSKFRFVTYII